MSNSGGAEQEILVRANSLRLGAYGVLILGETGAGKSALTLALLERAAWFGRSAALIGDDWTEIRCKAGALHAHNPPNIAGGLEIRGAGIFQMPFEPSGALHLAVELKGAGERYPQGHYWHLPQDCRTEKKAEIAPLPLLKLPEAGRTDILALCHAVEAKLFKRPYAGRISAGAPQ